MQLVEYTIILYHTSEMRPEKSLVFTKKYSNEFKMDVHVFDAVVNIIGQFLN